MGEPIKFFYDNFSQEDVAGMFGVPHIISIVLFFGLFALLRLTRGIGELGVRKIHVATAVVITVLEVLKIGIRIYKHQPPDSWVPLYFCSLFVFAVWAALSPVEPIRRTGYAYMTMGGCLAAVFFTLYPSTSFGMYPAWHPSVFHSFIFHFAMFFLGILVMQKKVYIPRARDAVGYFVFILCASVPSVILNRSLGTNCMFLRHAFKLPLLEPISIEYPLLYMLIVFFAQAVLLFFANYFLYLYLPRAVKYFKRKRRKE